jgi:minor extracellular serine protease Vpr
MLRAFFKIALLAAAVLALTAVAHAQTVPTSGSEAIELADGSQLWWIELSNPPVADGGTESALLAEQSTFRAAAAKARVPYTERMAFHNLWNGMSIAVKPEHLATLRTLPGVAGVYPVVMVEEPPTPVVSEPELLTALAMTGADIAQSQLGLTGQGVKVGIIDSGIDYDHPDLGGDGVARLNSPMFPNSRVVTGWDFVGDAYDPTTNPVAVPDAYPDACAAHGTHVAGIVGANGAVKGVAPGVTFGAYKVFGCGTTTSAEYMIAAMERALADGMDIVNMSIGASGQWPSYPTAAAATRLVNSGVIVVCSIGNSGPNGLYYASAPGVGKKVIGTASFDNTHINLNAITATPDGAAFGYTMATGAPAPPTSGSMPLARTGTQTSTTDACAALPPGSLTGKAVLIRRGGCTFYVKAFNAQMAGAAAVILYNNVAGALNPTVAGSPPITIPVVAMSAADGNELDTRLAAGPVTITWGGAVSTPNATGGQISSFSSWGPSPDLSVKPDIGAPGGYIRSTVPIELGGYDNFSGTSMASPHVAGAAALVLEAHPHTPANAMRDILQNNAVPHASASIPAELDNVHRQGAGMLDIPAAVLATTRIEPGKLSLGETNFMPVTASFMITNNGPSAVTYSLANQPALATGPDTYTPTMVQLGASATFTPSSVTVPAGGSASVAVTFSADPGLAEGSLFGGYVVVSPDVGEAQTVPYMGITGNYQALPALVPTPNGFPWLAKRSGTSYVNQPSGASFTMAGTDIPYILIHVHQPVSLVRAEVYSVQGKAWHRAFEIEDLARNSTATSFYAIGWDGETFAGRKGYVVPNGDYRITLWVRKALGGDDKTLMDGDWDMWVSPVITVARPALVTQQPTESDIDPQSVPTELFLAATSPNPSQGTTLFRFGMPNAGPATFEMFDVAGRRLQSWSWSVLPAGEHSVSWDGADDSGRRVGPGVVFYRLTALGQTLTRKVIRVE